MRFSFIASFAVGCAAFALGTVQAYQFSSTQDYRSMLEELHHDPVRPTRMSAGTLLSQTSQAVHVRAEDGTRELQLETDIWQLRIAKDRWQLELVNKQSGVSWQLGGKGTDNLGIAWQERSGESLPNSALGRVQHVEQSGDVWRMQVETGTSLAAGLEISSVSPTVIRLSISAPAIQAKPCCVTFDFRGPGPFFGLGERFDRVKLDGLKTSLLSSDFLGKPGHNWTYIPVPFLFTPRGLGVYFDAATESVFDLSEAQQSKFGVQVKTPSLDAYFFIGEPKKILEDYTSLTGRSPVPPSWAFGTWICSYQSPQRVLDEAHRLKESKIPATAIWTYDVMGKGDIMGWPLWWTGYYPHPERFTAQLHELGYKVLTYVHPYLRSVLDPYTLPNPSYQEGLRNGLFVLNAQGQPTGPGFEQYPDGNIDFTKSANVDWWEQKIRTILLDNNFDGWMEDFGEWVNDTDRFAAGVTGRIMANLNPLFYHKITYEVTHKAKPDAVGFSRSGYAGSQGFTPVVWGGDQFPTWDREYGLPSVVNAGMTAGLSGFATWTPDIASNGQSVELWTRWVEFGALTPIMRNHVWDKPEGAVNIWYNEHTIDTFRRYSRLHASLLPYLETYAQEAARTGLPIMRHPLLEFPDDPKVYDCSAEYMLGDKILVAPVIEQGASNRSLYLPKGDWIDYWTNEERKGGGDVNVPAPLDRIPILIRAGSILPFVDPDGNRFTWRVFPSETPSKSRFTLRDDTAATAVQDGSQIEVRVDHSTVSRHITVLIPAAHKPREVKLGGASLNEVAAGTAAEKTGWHMDSIARMLSIMFEARDFKLQVMQ